jgi:spore coat protein U-like protein
MISRPLVLGGCAVAAMLLLGPAPAVAQGTPSCTISTTSVAFGTYDVFSASPLTSTGTVRYRCNSQAANISITLSQGQSGTFSPRTLTKGAENLSYNLYRDAAASQVWGDGTGGTSTYTDANPPNNQYVTLTVYGEIPAAQDVSAGAYSDTVVATVNF